MTETLPAMSEKNVAKEVIINKKWCKGCGICISLCPKKVFTTDNSGKAAAVNQSLCSGCRMCENLCPDFAITIKVEQA